MPESCIFCFIGPDKICALCLKDRKQYYNRTHYLKKAENKDYKYKKCYTCHEIKPYEEYIGPINKHRDCKICKIKKAEIYRNKYYKQKPINKDFYIPKNIELCMKI